MLESGRPLESDRQHPFGRYYFDHSTTILPLFDHHAIHLVKRYRHLTT